MIARSPASACCWAATTCCWMAVKYCGKALKYCGTISPSWRMPALRVVLLGMRVAELGDGRHQGLLEASIDLSLASNCSSFSATGRTADLSPPR